MLEGNDKKALQYQALAICHAEDLVTIWSDADVIRYTNMHLPCTLEDTQKRIVRFQPFDVFAVLHNGAAIGIVGCPPVNIARLEFGLFYQFRKTFWGKGIATTAVEWMLAHMREKYGHPTLFADVVVDNAASEKILQKFDFVRISEELGRRDGTQQMIHSYQLRI